MADMTALMQNVKAKMKKYMTNFKAVCRMTKTKEGFLCVLVGIFVLLNNGLAVALFLNLKKDEKKISRPETLAICIDYLLVSSILTILGVAILRSILSTALRSTRPSQELQTQNSAPHFSPPHGRMRRAFLRGTFTPLSERRNIRDDEAGDSGHRGGHRAGDQDGDREDSEDWQGGQNGYELGRLAGTESGNETRRFDYAMNIHEDAPEATIRSPFMRAIEKRKDSGSRIEEGDGGWKPDAGHGDVTTAVNNDATVEVNGIEIDGNGRRFKQV